MGNEREGVDAVACCHDLAQPELPFTGAVWLERFFNQG